MKRSSKFRDGRYLPYSKNERQKQLGHKSEQEKKKSVWHFDPAVCCYFTHTEGGYNEQKTIPHVSDNVRSDLDEIITSISEYVQSPRVNSKWNINIRLLLQRKPESGIEDATPRKEKGEQKSREKIKESNQKTRQENKNHSHEKLQNQDSEDRDPPFQEQFEKLKVGEERKKLSKRTVEPFEEIDILSDPDVKPHISSFRKQNLNDDWSQPSSPKQIDGQPSAPKQIYGRRRWVITTK